MLLRFGRSPSAAPHPIQLGSVTVFVGPNNSGKSRILKEIGRFCTSGESSGEHVILDSLVFPRLTAESARKYIGNITEPNSPSGKYLTLHHPKGNQSVDRSELEKALTNPNGPTQRFCSYYIGRHTLMVDGTKRLQLVNRQSAGDLLQTPNGSFAKLFVDNEKRRMLQAIIYDAFSEHLIIDPSHSGSFRLKLSRSLPTDKSFERSLTSEALHFFASCKPIDEYSDGVKAYTGLLTEIVAGDPQILLIDEPEAFLHPPLASALGREISRAVTNNNKRAFVSTHSSHFVMGCIQSGVPVNIIRLTYSNDIATARVLPSEQLQTLLECHEDKA